MKCDQSDKEKVFECAACQAELSFFLRAFLSLPPEQERAFSLASLANAKGNRQMAATLGRATAARSRNARSLVIADVHRFPGHIVCDAASRSELVVPMLLGKRMIGMLVLDSPLLGRFDKTDRVDCERLMALVLTASDWPNRYRHAISLL